MAENTQSRLIIASKKIQINSLSQQQAQQFVENMKEKTSTVTIISIQGNSYSLDFCREFSEKYLSQAVSLQSLDISDIFVSRTKEQIPASIEAIAISLKNIPLKHLDISHNAVNPFGAKALLNFLAVAKTLQTLLIMNCGLGPRGVKEIAIGLQGTPNLKSLSIARNRMQDQGIIYLSEKLKFVPNLENLFVYQNYIRKDGFKHLFSELRHHCKNLKTFDLGDNFVRQQATVQLQQLIIENLALQNLNLSDSLKQSQNLLVVKAFEETKNRNFTRLGFNYIELQTELAVRLVAVLKQCPLKKLDVLGNDFKKKVKNLFSQTFEAKILSKFDEDDEDEDQVTRLLEDLKI